MSTALSVLSLALLLPCSLGACSTGWRCMVEPSLGQDGKRVVQIYGFDIKCTKRF